MNRCYRCNRENPDYDWTSLCFVCRQSITTTAKVQTFLDRLTAEDLTFFQDLRIAVEPDMHRAVHQKT